jgi:hypothetical protein
MNAITTKQWRLAAELMLAAARRLADVTSKANFDPNQPRVPAGQSGAGQWTDGRGGAISRWAALRDKC